MSLPLLHSPAHIISELLVNLSLGTYPDDNGSWSIFIASEANTPDSVLTVYNTTSIIDGQSHIDGEVYEHYGFMIRIRSYRNDVGYLKANAIAKSLAEDVVNNLVNIDGTTYIICACNRKGGVNDLGKVESPTSERNVFTINYTAAIYRTV